MNAVPQPWRSAASPHYSLNPTPAYTTVQARRSFPRPIETPTSGDSTPSQPPAAAAPATKSKLDWPPSVRQYVQRSFVPEHQIPGISRVDMETKLKQVITDAAEGNRLGDINWDALPLPQQMIQSERTARTAVSTPPWANQPPPSPARLQKESSRKRKSFELGSTADEKDNSPPWRKANIRTQLEDRVSYSPKTDKRQRIEISNKDSSKFKQNLESRRKRFEDSRPGLSPQYSSRDDSPADQGPVVGRCQDLEKNYFRLTAAPNPDTVRPLPVLQQTLELLKKKWRKENNYSYICDQFKSLRQDLTVQHIKSEFTVHVYEIHARIALEKGDLGEYNQCQTQLRALYAQNLGGHPTEFMAYRILYFIHTRNRTAMNDALADLTPADKEQPAVKHALEVRSALALGNYHRFFQLYLDTPNMGAYLMDMFVDRERLSALACICKAYKPDVNIRFITEELGFESDEQSVRFVLEHASAELLQEKEGGVRFLTGKAGLIFEQAKREAHKIVDIKGQI